MEGDCDTIQNGSEKLSVMPDLIRHPGLYFARFGFRNKPEVKFDFFSKVALFQNPPLRDSEK